MRVQQFQGGQFHPTYLLSPWPSSAIVLRKSHPAKLLPFLRIC